MTAVTVLFLNGISTVGFFEFAGITVMAGKAEFGSRTAEQIFFRGGMNAVTTQAAIVLDNPVYDFTIVFFLVVAGKTDRIAFCRQEIRVIGGMGVVTGNTFPPSHCGMDILLIQLEILNLMTGITEVITIFFKDEFRDYAMPKMTLFAFFFRDHFMDVLHGKIFFAEIRMTVQAAFFGEFPSRGLGIFTESQGDQAAGDKSRS
ncbi:MAG: hypothetical protein R6W72_01615 [Desulfurivibrionaceae bacterium]